MGNVSKQRSMLTKEIAWAFHTTQQDTLIQECIEKEEEISWNLLKKYGVALWIENLEKMKGWVDGIARNEYKKTK